MNGTLRLVCERPFRVSVTKIYDSLHINGVLIKKLQTSGLVKHLHYISTAILATKM